MSAMTPTLIGKLRCLQTLLQQLGANVACEAVSEAIEQLADANLAQPAQSVDVRNVVLKSLGGYLERHWPDNPVSYDDMADKLTAALQEKGNG